MREGKARIEKIENPVFGPDGALLSFHNTRTLHGPVDFLSAVECARGYQSALGGYYLVTDGERQTRALIHPAKGKK